MRRRSRASNKTAKARSRKAVARNRRDAPKVRGRDTPAHDPDTEIARVIRERDEAREQQKATAEILRVIRASPADVQPVFEMIVRNAVSLCGSKHANVFRFDGELLHFVASHNVGGRSPVDMLREKFPMRPDSSQVAGRAVLKKEIIRLEDALTDPDYDHRIARATGFRRALGVPMLREDDLLGVIVVSWAEAGPVPKVQEELLKTFADQAVIAIENARLLNELRQRTDELSQRTDDLSEALEQQTATSEVLSVISSSPGELEPVFQAMLENATRICEAKFGNLFRFDGENFYPVAQFNTPAALLEAITRRGPFKPTPGISLDHVMRTKQVFHSADTAAEPVSGLSTKLGGARSQVTVPMLKDDALIGAILIYRQEVRPFTNKQIELVKNFAAQAVIAIENTRLLNELRQSLEQQSATSEVLRVISSSPGELKPVFQAMLENAVRVCGAKFGVLYFSEGDGFRTVAMHDVPPAFAELREREPVVVPTPGGGLDQLTKTKQVVHITDYSALPPQARGRLGDLGGARTVVTVPMFKDNDLAGAIVIYRQEVRPFTEKQIELLQNFAAQAVIAIENTRLLNELRESLQQQTATAEVLRVISSSPGELEPVFQNLLDNATRLCAADFGLMAQYNGSAFQLMAQLGGDPAYVEYLQREPFRPGPETLTGRVLQTRGPVQIEDFAKSKGYLDRDPIVVVAVERGGVRTTLGVPMLRENELIGIISLYRQEVRLFTDKQIELLQNFAAQAVIAIENARLLNELRESLQQQTATSEVLGVISSSPSDLGPVFETVLANATRLCDATFGLLLLYEGDWRFRQVAMCNVPSALAELRQREPIFEVSRETGLGRAVTTKAVIHIADYAEEPIYRERRHPAAVALGELGGARTYLVVPMLKDKEIAGAIAIYRQQVRPFTDKQIELVKSFASQAVIAIENARLLNELRQRTADLGEALDQQTATSKVLEVISRSAFDLQAVFETVVESSVRLCGADRAFIFRFDGELLRMTAALNNASQEWREYLAQHPTRPGRDSAAGRAALERRTVHIPDVQVDQEYTFGAKNVEKVRTVLAVPILKGEDLLGVVVIHHLEVRPFTEKQIALIETFADQAAIAIDNVRLLDELRQSLEQQTATADMLKLISRSTFDLKSVLDTLVESAARLCAADITTISREKDGHYHVVAAYGFPPGLQDYYETMPIESGRGSLFGRILFERKPVQIVDVLADPEYAMRELQKRAGFRTVLGVPLLRDGVPIGLLSVNRTTVRPFTDKQIEIVTAFADQAAIAIENVRLFDEIQDKSRQLEEASQHKSQFLANMSHELRTPLNAILGYTELMADGAYGEPSEKMLGILKRLEANGKHLLGLINDVLDLSKIEAGQLMLELSDYCIQDIAQTVRSTLEPLASDKKLGFKVEVAPQLPPGHGDGRRLTQVLINLVGNAIKFTDAGEVAIKAEANNGSFHVSVRDTGPGISSADQARLFQEFQQADNAITKKKGGTGLGLAISKRIIEMHGGRIWVESQPGQGSTFTFTLPVVVERQVEAA
jgi:GAF domain-containing protein